MCFPTHNRPPRTLRLCPMPSTLPAAALALVALAATASATGNPLDPFPSLRSVGDTVYTKFSAVITNVTGNGTKANVAGK